MKGGARGAPPKRSSFEDEDRSRDWYCPTCKERNFMKRPTCFKCQSNKPEDAEACAGPPRPKKGPKSGDTLDGMVKSYNRKGFGFIMSLGEVELQDIYYSRESLAPSLQTRDIPGQHVTFEVVVFSDGKITAKNVRPQGENWETACAAPAPRPMSDGAFHGGYGKGGRDEEDRTRDWVCNRCTERNFVKRFECFKCQTPRAVAGGFEEPPILKRRCSPHAGSRAVRDELAAKFGKGKGGARSRSPRRRSRSDSSSGSSSKAKKKKSKKKKKKQKSSSSSSSSSSAEAADAGAGRTGGDEDAAPVNPEVDKAKSEALEQLTKLRAVEPRDMRMQQFRALLRQWHPDKNPDNAEVATAVFQFLQKGKPMIG